jgi:hypothetical protein
VKVYILPPLLHFLTFLRANLALYSIAEGFRKSYYSVRREVLYNILTEFGVPAKLVRLIKMCLNEMYSKVHIGKPLLFNSASEYAISNAKENRWD